MSIRLILCGLLLLAPPACAAGIASPDETARFLAGMQVSAASPLATLADTRAWKAHQISLDSAFNRVEKAQLAKIRLWSKAHLTVERPTLFYMFSGPDFLYADAFFPNAGTYVLCGLEPVGGIPDLRRLRRSAIPWVLGALRISMRSVLTISFFRTLDMRSDLRASPVNGTLPLLYVFLARSGKIIREVSLLQLDEYGDVEPAVPPRAGHAQGARITFQSPGGPVRTLYYFSANVAGGGFAKEGLQAFCERLGEGDSFIKSASYLLHGGAFAQVRTFLLQYSAAILQDDTGIPVGQFDAGWQLTPFGRYVRPISLFARQFQPKLAALFRAQPSRPLDFGIGYHFRSAESNLMLAVKLSAAAGGAR